MGLQSSIYRILKFLISRDGCLPLWIILLSSLFLLRMLGCLLTKECADFFLSFKSFLHRASFICLHPNIAAMELIMRNDVIVQTWHTVQLPKRFHKYRFKGSHLVSTKPRGERRVRRMPPWAGTCAWNNYYLHCVQRNRRLRGAG